MVSTAATLEILPVSRGAVGPLHGTRILVIEDEFLIATVIEDVLRDAGAGEVVVALTQKESHDALAAATPFDAAVVDIQLAAGTDSGLALAEIAAKRKIPIVFLTGYESDLALPEPFSTARLLTKPYAPRALVEAVSAAIATAGKPGPSP
jgi:CheY-like chemotaxis protein